LLMAFARVAIEFIALLILLTERCVARAEGTTCKRIKANAVGANGQSLLQVARRQVKFGSSLDSARKEEIHIELGQPEKYSLAELSLDSCPPLVPACATSCSNEGMKCSYGADEKPDSVVAICQDGLWEITTARSSCRATVKATTTLPRTTSPAQCPEFAPEAGESCPDPSAQCQYGRYVCQGDEYYTTFASCNNSSWKIVTAAKIVCKVDSSSTISSPMTTTTSIPLQCPISTPEFGENCTSEGLHACKYGLHVCPLGDSYYSTFASCVGGKWKIAVASIQCLSSTTTLSKDISTTPSIPTTALPAECPEFCPKSEDACFQSGLLCKYGIYICPLGETYYTTSAACVDSSWNISIASIVCETTSQAPLVSNQSSSSTFTTTVLTAECPDNIPDSDSACTNNGTECKYFACSPGEETNITLAICVEASWALVKSMMTCPNDALNSSNASDEEGSSNAFAPDGNASQQSGGFWDWLRDLLAR